MHTTSMDLLVDSSVITRACAVTPRITRPGRGRSCRAGIRPHPLEARGSRPARIPRSGGGIGARALGIGLPLGRRQRAGLSATTRGASLEEPMSGAGPSRHEAAPTRGTGGERFRMRNGIPSGVDPGRVAALARPVLPSASCLRRQSRCVPAPPPCVPPDGPRPRRPRRPTAACG